jgi:hypothetical protein
MVAEPEPHDTLCCLANLQLTMPQSMLSSHLDGRSSCCRAGKTGPYAGNMQW